MEITQDWSRQLLDSLAVLYPVCPTEPMICAEIGAFEGQGSRLLVNLLCGHTDSKLYCIDPWDDEYVKTDPRLSHWDPMFHGQYGRFVKNTQGVPKIVPLKGTSDVMIPGLPSIDFVYIDGDHSPEQVYKDACAMMTRMKPGGIILFDDYGWGFRGLYTKDGINKFLEEYKERVEVIFIKYQAAVRVK